MIFFMVGRVNSEEYCFTSIFMERSSEPVIVVHTFSASNLLGNSKCFI